MPTLWIHRECASAILVRFSGSRITDAIYLGVRFLQENVEDESEITWQLSVGQENRIGIGYTNNIQISIMNSDDFCPDLNAFGIVQVAEDEARDLGLTGEPEGFVQGPNDEVWRMDNRSEIELDSELSAYHNGL